MKTSLSTIQLKSLVDNQANNLIPDSIKVDIPENIINHTIMRVEFCFSNINRKYYKEENETTFNHLHSDQYCIFLYFLSNTLFNEGAEDYAAKIFLLNKALHGIDVFYSIKLPDIFYFCHPLGTVLGNAEYKDYFIAYQGVTVGSDLNQQGEGGEYPKLSKGVTLLANSTIIGCCNIGENVIFAANSLLKKGDISSNKIVVNQYPNNRILPNKNLYLSHYFGQKQA